MDVHPEIREQLHSLRIPREQRPKAGTRGSRAGRRVVLVLVVAGLAAGAFLKRERLLELAGTITRTAEAAEVPVIRVEVQQEPQAAPVLTATGKIVSDHKVQVATKVSGQIVGLLFEQGDRVKKGQVLARIEDVIYRARRDEAAARLEKSKANLAFQKFNAQRTGDLYKKGNAPEVEYIDSQRALREAEAQIAADQAALDFAQKSLTDCEVLAPISGVILERNVEVGDFVAAEGGRGANANAQFGLIADMSMLRVEVDVSELDIARIRAGMPCTVTPEAYKDRKYRGYVLWIDPGANYSKATVQVKVRIENPDDYLRVEGSAQVIFVQPAPASAPATQNSPAVWIPSSACLVDAGGTRGTVFVVSGGRLRETSISIGRRSNGQLEVVGGLTGGESIAGSGVEKLANGQRVRS